MFEMEAAGNEGKTGKAPHRPKKRRKQHSQSTASINSCIDEIDKYFVKVLSHAFRDAVVIAADGSRLDRSCFKVLDIIASNYEHRVNNSLTPVVANPMLFLLGTYGARFHLVQHPRQCYGSAMDWTCGQANRYFKLEGERHFNLPELLRFCSQSERELAEAQDAAVGVIAPGSTLLTRYEGIPIPVMKVVRWILQRQWDELGRYMNICDAFRVRSDIVVRQKNRTFVSGLIRDGVYIKKRYRSFTFLYNFLPLLWQSSMLRLLYLEVPDHSKTARVLDFVRRFATIQFFRSTTYSVMAFYTDALIFLLHLGESHLLPALFDAEASVHDEHKAFEYNVIYRAYKALVQYDAWRERRGCDGAKTIVQRLMEHAQDERGVVFVQAALRALASMEDAEDEMIDAATEYAETNPRTARVVAAQLRELQMDDEASVLVEKVVKRGSVHAADPVWIEWAETRMRNPRMIGIPEQVCTEVAEAMLSFLDFAPNRGNAQAWNLLDLALRMSNRSSIESAWRERGSWWDRFHRSISMDNNKDMETRERVLGVLHGL